MSVISDLNASPYMYLSLHIEPTGRHITSQHLHQLCMMEKVTLTELHAYGLFPNHQPGLNIMILYDLINICKYIQNM